MRDLPSPQQLAIRPPSATPFLSPLSFFFFSSFSLSSTHGQPPFGVLPGAGMRHAPHQLIEDRPKCGRQQWQLRAVKHDPQRFVASQLVFLTIWPSNLRDSGPIQFLVTSAFIPYSYQLLKVVEKISLLAHNPKL